MQPDEQAIRDLVRAWMEASAGGDLDRVLTLMADDVVFLTPGRQPFGKEAFAAASRASAGQARLEGAADVQEVHVSGDLAFCRVRLGVRVTTPEGWSSSGSRASRCPCCASRAAAGSSPGTPTS